MTDLLTSEHFTPHVDKVFRVKGGRHALTLAQVEARKLDDKEASLVQRQPFLLIFRGPPGDGLREGLYTLEVEDGPSFELYVIPIQTPVLGRQDYQVAFN